MVPAGTEPVGMILHNIEARVNSYDIFKKRVKCIQTIQLYTLRAQE